jgi:hypothetical protein
MRSIVTALTLMTATGFCSAAVADEQTNKTPSPAQAAPSSPPNAAGSSDEQFVQILAQLASIRLERVNQINAKVPGSVPPDDVALMELQAKSIDALRPKSNDAGQVSGYAMLVSLAEISHASAAQEWKRVSAIEARSPGTISKQEAEMVRLRAELAEVILARGKSAATRSPQDQQNWALQLLFVELQSLRDAVQSLEARQ